MWYRTHLRVPTGRTYSWKIYAAGHLKFNIMSTTAQNVDEAKRDGESTESESITEAETETDVADAEAVAESTAECKARAEAGCEYETQLAEQLTHI